MPPSSGDISRIQWELVTGSPGWPSRGYHSTLVFKGKLLIMGGATITYQPGSAQTVAHNDVWSSADGVTWMQLTANAGWERRMGHSATVDPSNTKIYLMGGLQPGTDTYMNDVWSTVDGASWTRVTLHAPWGGRWLHTAISFQGNMWIVGGFRCGSETAPSTREYASDRPCNEVNMQPGYYYRDVWVERVGGSGWDRSTEEAAWSGRGGHGEAPKMTR